MCIVPSLGTPISLKMSIYNFRSSNLHNLIKETVYQFLKDISKDDEPSVIGERVASVYWEGFLKYVNHHLGKFEPKGIINFQPILTQKRCDWSFYNIAKCIVI